MTPLTALPEILAPRRTALLVVDVQNDFVHPDGWAGRRSPPPPSFPAALARINELIDAARRHLVTVAYIRTLHGPEHDLSNYRARYAARGMEDEILCRAGGWGAELDARLRAPERGDLLISKSGYDAFARTELRAELLARAVETVVVCGFVTNLCVQTTLHHAFAEGFYTVLAEDACAAASAPEHAAAVDLCRRFFGPALPTHAVVQEWQAVPALQDVQ